MIRSCVRRILTVFLLAGAGLLLCSCSSDFSGTYAQTVKSKPRDSLTFIAGHKVLLTAQNGSSTEWDYKIANGKFILLANREYSFSIGKDNCLISDEQFGTYCKQATQDARVTALVATNSAIEGKKNTIWAILAVFLAILSILVYRNQKLFPPENRQLKAGGTLYNLFSVRGVVVGKEKHRETHVSGGGGGSPNAPVTITSSTTVHDEFFLRDSGGTEHSFHLTDFDISCRDGQDVTVIWAIKDGGKKGPYIAVINHTTSTRYFHKAMAAMFSPANAQVGVLSLCFFAAILFIVNQNNTLFDRDGIGAFLQIIITLFCWIILLIPVGVVMGVMGNASAAKFNSRFNIEDGVKG